MNLDDAPRRVREFWTAFDPQRAHAHRFYEPFKVGLAESDADHGARAILDGSKTATSSLLWEYEHSGRAPPHEGALSVVLDGRYQPVCVVETTEIWIANYDRVDARFCRDYAESDGSIDGWRALTWPVYQVQCMTIGRRPSLDMPLVCERMSVVFPCQPDARRRALASIDSARRPP